MSRPLSILFGLASWALSGFLMLAGLLWGLTLKCDDACSTVGGWRHDPDAWQWNAMAALGVVAFLAGGALFVFVLLRRPLLAAVAVVVGAPAVLLLMGAFSSDWIDHLDRRSGGELLLMLTGAFAPILAVLLTIGQGNVRT